MDSYKLLHLTYLLYFNRRSPPVDKLVYLETRTKVHKRTEAAILVSSEAGYLRFWSIYHNKHELGINNVS